MKIEVTGVGFAQLRAKSRARKRRISYPALAFDEIRQYLLSSEQALFNSSGRRGGGSWKRLTRDWLRRKHRQGDSLNILEQKGILEASLTEAGHPLQVFEYDNNQMVFGTTRSGAGAHQEGVPGRLPRRPVIKVTEKDREAFALILARFLVRGE